MNELRGYLADNISSEGALGFKGETGMSAYELAVKHGYEGTEQDWIDHFGLDLTDYIQTSDVVDSTTSTSTSYPLSANQGKNLKDNIDGHTLRLNTIDENMGDLTSLQTPVTTDLVSAVNSIVESGSNTNGRYVKFSDGTMICTKTVSGTTNISEAWGDGYTSGASSSISFGAWAETFIATPVVSVTVQRSGSNSWLTGVDSISTTNAGAASICRFTTGTSVPYTIHVTGIGRWK